MDRKTADNILEELAIISVTIENLSRKISKESRKEIAKDLGTLLKACTSIESEIGFKIPDIHPHYLGWENYSQLRKKHEDPEHPVVLPTEEQLEQAREQWSKIQNFLRR